MPNQNEPTSEQLDELLLTADKKISQIIKAGVKWVDYRQSLVDYQAAVASGTTPPNGPKNPPKFP